MASINSRFIAGLEITSSDDIVVYRKNPAHGTSEAFLIFPMEDIGKDYIVTSHKLNGGSIQSRIAIVATEPATELTLIVPGKGQNLSVEIGNAIIEQGQTLKTRLEKYEIAQLKSSSDVTGVRLLANHPVAVYLEESSKVTSEAGAMVTDHYRGQLIPTDKWGKSYVALPHSVTGDDDEFRIIGKYGNPLPHPFVIFCVCYFATQAYSATKRTENREQDSFSTKSLSKRGKINVFFFAAFILFQEKKTKLQ